jgi:DNA-binding response OmpR family regulator
MMPMVDGFATLEQIKKTNDCNIASQQKKERILKGLSLGANLYVTKPFQ